MMNSSKSPVGFACKFILPSVGTPEVSLEKNFKSALKTNSNKEFTQFSTTSLFINVIVSESSAESLNQSALEQRNSNNIL